MTAPGGGRAALVRSLAEEGRVVEEGSHAELLTRGGLYRRLHDMQYFGETETPVGARP